MQKPLSSILSQIQPLSFLRPTNPTHDIWLKASRGAEGVFSWFLSSLRQLSSSLITAVDAMKRTAILTLAGMLTLSAAQAMPLETLNEWELHLYDKELILAQRSGEVTNGDRLFFVFRKDRCNEAIQIFEMYTTSTHPSVTNLLETKLEMTENGSPIEGKVVDVTPFLSGNVVLVELGVFTNDELIRYYSVHRRFEVEITHHHLQKNVPVNMIFDVPVNEWKIPDIQQLIERASYHCERIPNETSAHLQLTQPKGTYS